MFYPIHSLVFSRNRRPKPASKDCEVSKSAFIFSTQASVVIELLEFFEFSPHQSSKTHPNSILPTGNHNTQHKDTQHNNK
jgi:hypothetical protein